MDEKPAKRKKRPIPVYTLPEEYEAIHKQASMAGLPMSVYLRRVGMGVTVNAVIDREQVLMLGKVNADQGRLGGLLKLWLTDEEKRSGMEIQIRQLLKDIEALKEEMTTIVKRI